MKMKKETVIFLTFLFIFISVVILFGNRRYSSGIAYYTDIAIIDKELWYLTQPSDFGFVDLYKYNGHTKYASLRNDSNVKYSEGQKSFFFITNHELVAYRPDNNQISEICKVDSDINYLSMLSEDYILLRKSSNIYKVYSFLSNQLEEIDFSEDIKHIWDCKDNLILYSFDNETKPKEERLCVYDLAAKRKLGDFLTDSTGRMIQSAQLYKGNIYFSIFEEDGIYYISQEKIGGEIENLELQKLESPGRVIEMKASDSSLFIAELEENKNISFGKISETGLMQPLTSWDNKSYFNPKTHKMVLSDDYMAFVLFNSEEIFFEKISNY